MPKFESQRVTRTYSFAKEDEIWLDRLKADAKKNRRSTSGHMILLVKDYFDRVKILNRLQKNGGRHIAG